MSGTQFEVEEVVAVGGVLASFENFDQIRAIIRRHTSGDRGDMPVVSVLGTGHKSAIQSNYTVANGVQICVVTKFDPPKTFLFLSSEFRTDHHLLA